MKNDLQDGDLTSMAMNHVELATSELFNLPGVDNAYHTSMLVNSEEYFFSDSGFIFGPHAHEPPGDQDRAAGHGILQSDGYLPDACHEGALPAHERRFGSEKLQHLLRLCLTYSRERALGPSRQPGLETELVLSVGDHVRVYDLHTVS